MHTKAFEGKIPILKTNILLSLPCPLYVHVSLQNAGFLLTSKQVLNLDAFCNLGSGGRFQYWLHPFYWLHHKHILFQTLSILKARREKFPE